MKVLIGWLLGVGTVWAALAIWHRVPEFPDVDASTAAKVEVGEDEHGIFLRGDHLPPVWQGACTGMGGGSIFNNNIVP